MYGTSIQGEQPNEGMCQSSVNYIQKILSIKKSNLLKQDEAYYIHEFLEFLSVCHTVVSDKDPKAKLFSTKHRVLMS